MPSRLPLTLVDALYSWQTMGGIKVDAQAHVLDEAGAPIPGLYAAGEAIGGVHGQNRLGGSSLLEAVIFGRIAGEQAVKGL